MRAAMNHGKGPPKFTLKISRETTTQQLLIFFLELVFLTNFITLKHVINVKFCVNLYYIPQTLWMNNNNTKKYVVSLVKGVAN